VANWKRRLWKWTAGAFAALVILLAVVAGLFRLLTPLVPSYRLQVERWASTALQHPVEIHSMGAEWGWNGPQVALQDVRILSHDGKTEVVAAQEVLLGLDWRNLVHGRLPRPSRVVLVGPHMEVERDAQGNYAIRGLGTAALQNQTDWRTSLQEALVQSAEIVVKDGQLTLFDARHPAPTTFKRISMRIDNSPADHRLHGETQLPPEFGKSFSFDLDIQGEGIDPKLWDWQLQSKGVSLQLPRILSYVPLDQPYLAAGLSDLQLDAASRQGVLQHAELDVDARNLASAPPLGSSVVALLQGAFDWKRSDTGWHLQARHLLLQRTGMPAWTKTDLDLDYAQAQDGAHWSGDAGFLRLQDLAALTAWLPPSAKSNVDRVHAFEPTGDVSNLDFKLRWDGKAPQDWSAKADFINLGSHAAEGFPGAAGLTGSLNLAVSGGEVKLDSPDAQLDFRPLFRNSLRGSAKLTVRVDHDARGWRAATDSFQVANPDTAVHGRAGLQFPVDGSAPVLDIDATVERGDARNKSLYLPVGIMPKEVVDWLDRSIKGGQVTSGSVSIHGKVSDFPFTDNKGGTFDIQFHVQHAELDYFPGWPVLKDMDADVRFLDQGLQAKAHGGTIQNLVIQDGASASFADLSTGVLQVDGAGKGNAGDALELLRQIPVNALLDGYLDDFTAKGNLTGQVHFTLPVTHAQDFVLKGKAELQQVSIGLRAWPGLTAEQLQGPVDFGNYGVSTEGLQGRLLGGPLSLAVKLPSPNRAHLSVLSAHGDATAPGIGTALGYGSERWLTGHTAWQVDGKIPMQSGARLTGLQFALQSDLSGLGMQLPAPFGKAEAESRPVHVGLQMASKQDMSIVSNYDAVLGLRLGLKPHKGDAGFDRGEMRIGSGSAPKPAEPGFVVEGVLPSFDWDEWKSLLPPSTTADVTATPRDRGSVVPAFLRSIDISVGHAAGFGQSVDGLRLTLDRSDDGWDGSIQSASIVGTLNVPTRVDAEHPMVLDMDRMLLADKSGGLTQLAKPAADPNQPKTEAAKLDPRSIPALKFSIKQFQFGAMSLNNVGLTLVPQADGIALEDVKVSDPSFTISGDGVWTSSPAGQQRTALNADVESKDVEKSLQSLGFDAGITGDKGSIVTSLNWRDSPMGDVVPTLGGTLHIDLQDGQIKDVKPGAGRLFGLLSITALPRRLLLNFSDVFAKGFGYDSIVGDFTLQEGDAYTQNLEIKGPAASIHLIGRTGLAKQDFDEAMVVDPSVSSTLPVVGALAAGVGVGAVVFLLTEIFKSPLTKAGEVRYHLTGTWEAPVLTKVTTPAPAATTRKP